MRHVGAVAVIAVVLSATLSSAATAQQFVDVRQVATDTLHDVAVTVIAAGRPTIYVSPALMQELGPAISAFAMGHEYGHVRYGHTGGALGVSEGHSTDVRIHQELEADCYAARILAETNPTAVSAALQYFTRLGPFRFDRVHPAGAQRAAMIQSCLPTSNADSPLRETSTR